MTRTIAVPLDGGALAERALAPASALALAHRAELRLVMVHRPAAALLPANAPDRVAARLDRELRDAAGAYLNRRLLEVAGSCDLTVGEALLEGDPATALADYARRVDLIVMATHGRGGVSRLWLGSVADRLIRLVDQPVLLVHAHDERPADSSLFDRVLVALDGTAEAETALAAVERWRGHAGGAVHLIQVVEPLIIFTAAPGAAPAYPHLGTPQERALDADHYLRRLAAGIRPAPTSVGIHVPIAVDPASEILAHARRHNATLVALATHRREPATRWVLGSVADKVIRGGGQPVLVCPASSANDPP